MLHYPKIGQERDVVHITEMIIQFGVVENVTAGKSIVGQ
jgi:hypothetical protein